MFAYRFAVVGLLLTALTGCSKPQTPARPPQDEEAAVRQAFAESQETVKAGDADKLWTLLSSKRQADAERAAQAVREAYAKASPEKRAREEKELELSGAELASLTGKGFLRTERFRRKIKDLPGSEIGRVVVEGDNATVRYTEPDGDKEKAIFFREYGQWNVWLTMPRGGR
jgi:hypothetical protein